MGLEFWANVSAVWLSLLCFIGLLIPLVAAYFAIRGMHFVLEKSRSAMATAQDYSRLVRHRTDTLSRRVATPVIKAERKAAEIDTVIRRVVGDSAK